MFTRTNTDPEGAGVRAFFGRKRATATRVAVTTLFVLFSMMLATAVVRASGIAATPTFSGRAKDVGDALLAAGGTVGTIAGLMVTTVVFAVQGATTRLGRLEFLLPILVRRLRFLELTTGIITFAGINVTAGLFLRLQAEDIDPAGGSGMLAVSICGTFFSTVAIVSLFRQSVDLSGRDLASYELLRPIVKEYRQQRRRQLTEADARGRFNESIKEAGWTINPWTAAFTGSAKCLTLHAPVPPGRIVSVNIGLLRRLKQDITSAVLCEVELSLTTIHDGEVSSVSASVLAVDRKQGLTINEPRVAVWSARLAKAFRTRPIEQEEGLVGRIALRLPYLARYGEADRLDEALRVIAELLIDDLREGTADPQQPFERYRGWVDLIDACAEASVLREKRQLVINTLDRLAVEAGGRGDAEGYRWSCSLLWLLYDRCAMAQIEPAWLDEEYDSLLNRVAIYSPAIREAGATSTDSQLVLIWTRLFLNCCRTAGENNRFGAIKDFLDRFDQVFDREGWPSWPAGAAELPITPRLRTETLANVFLTGWVVKLVSTDPQVMQAITPVFDLLRARAKTQELVYAVWRSTPGMFIERGLVEEPENWGRKNRTRSMIAFTPPPLQWPQTGMIAFMLMCPTVPGFKWSDPSHAGRVEDLSVEVVEDELYHLLTQPGIPELLLEDRQLNSLDSAGERITNTIKSARLATAKEKLTNFVQAPVNAALVDAYRSAFTKALDTTSWLSCFNDRATLAVSDIAQHTTFRIRREALAGTETELIVYFARKHAQEWLRRSATDLANALTRTAVHREIDSTGHTPQKLRELVDCLRASGWSPDAVVVHGGGRDFRSFIDRNFSRPAVQGAVPWQAGTFDALPVYNAPPGLDAAEDRWVVILDTKAALAKSRDRRVDAVLENDITATTAVLDQIAACQSEAELTTNINIDLSTLITVNSPLFVANPDAVALFRLQGNVDELDGRQH